MAEYAPVYMPGTAYSTTASAAITGGQLVEVTGSGTVGPAAGTNPGIGIAANDAAANSRVAVYLGNLVQEATTSANVTAGNPLKAAAGGTVAPWVSGTDGAHLQIGLALTTATSGATVRYLNRN